MNILTGINNVLMFLNEHWTQITIILGLGTLLWKKGKAFLAKSDEEKIQIALKQAKEIILNKVTAAEIDYAEWKKSGAVKRAQVLDEIFKQYPILSKVTSQEEIIKKLDSYIDEALVTLREIIMQQNKVLYDQYAELGGNGTGKS